MCFVYVGYHSYSLNIGAAGVGGLEQKQETKWDLKLTEAKERNCTCKGQAHTGLLSHSYLPVQSLGNFLLRFMEVYGFARWGEETDYKENSVCRGWRFHKGEQNGECEG